MKSLSKTQPETAGWADRMSDLRQRTGRFIGDALEAVLYGPADKFLEWVDDKPAIAVGAFVAALFVEVGEVVGGTLATMAVNAEVGTAAAVAVGAATVYTWFQTYLIAGGLYEEIA